MVDPKQVVTPECRISYPAVFKPKLHKDAKPGDQPRYSVEMIFPKDADLTAMKAAVKAAIKDKWGDKPPKSLNLPFKDGNEKDKDGYEDSIFVGAWSHDKPDLVVAPSGTELTEHKDFYGGCYAKVSVKAFAYDKGGNKGVSFALNNILKTRDGEPFGFRRRSAAEDFADVDMEAYGAEDTVDSLL